MGTLLSYSGISTKIRAMKSKLIGDAELEEIIQLTDVPQVIAYLMRTPEFSHIWSSLDENSLHRGDVEILLRQSIFSDFSRLYNFANGEQRRFLELYAKGYEIRILKELLTRLFDHQNTDPVNLAPYEDFFQKHSKLDLEKLSLCTTMQEFLDNLKGNEFYRPLKRMQNGQAPTLFDYSMALDLYYFTLIWNVRKKLFRGKDLEELTRTYGEQFDLLNLQFIQRSRVYFRMRPEEIYSLLISVNYKLSKYDIQALVETEPLEQARQYYDRTYYGKRHARLPEMTLEEFYNHTLRSILEKEARENPHSVAILFSYMYHKEHEIDRLTTAIECVRYGISPSEAMRYIRNN
ncbi:MAG: V-type ATPase subunit [Eubacteriales bacterium]|nr:V-type ATPase subunit [Eubacteriales bacterium]